MELKTVKVYENDWKKLMTYKIKGNMKCLADVIKEFIEKENRRK